MARRPPTIHRLLGAGYNREQGQLAFSKDEEDPLDAQAIIVDEASMVDVPLMAALLRAMKNECRLVLVGDPDQLPSVGPGRVFDHLIRSDVIPTVYLTEIFRQAQESAIIRNAHAVNRGILPQLDNRSRDFFFLAPAPGRPGGGDHCGPVQKPAAQQYGDSHRPDSGGSPPTRKHITGTKQLNAMLQAALNPPAPDKRERKYGLHGLPGGGPGDAGEEQLRRPLGLRRREGGGAWGSSTGTSGQITAIDPSSGLVTVDFEGHLAQYTPDMMTR